MTEITTIAEYEYCCERGKDPLKYPLYLMMAIDIRRKVQRRMFGETRIGKRDISQANEVFYRWCWDNKPHQCEECMKPLSGYSATFISHILTRGAHPEMAHDPRNVNILCFDHHNQWENENRKAMRIYDRNEKTIEQLRHEYGDK